MYIQGCLDVEASFLNNLRMPQKNFMEKHYDLKVFIISGLKLFELVALHVVLDMLLFKGLKGEIYLEMFESLSETSLLLVMHLL